MTSSETASKLFTTFPDELALLTPHTRSFVIDAFQRCCPDHFWKIPASTSSKYHPAIALGEGGLIRHVKLAVWWGRELCRINPESLNEYQVIAALLLHDIWKNGSSTLTPFPGTTKWPKGPNNITAIHGGLLADKLLTEVGIWPGEIGIADIAYAIGGHMGRWTDPSYQHYTAWEENHHPERAFLISTVHYADYCASRRLPEDQR